MKKLNGEAYRNTRLCVDSYDCGEMKGCYFNQGFEEGQRFESLSQLLTELESLLDGANIPQSYTTPRAFVPMTDFEMGEEAGDGERRGKLGTFNIRIMFRQHSSWQGSVTWVEGKGSQMFRSVLELVLLLDSALGGCKRPKKDKKAKGVPA